VSKRRLVDDPTVGLKIDNIVTDMYKDGSGNPLFDKETIGDICDYVYLKMNITPLYDQAKELIDDYVKENSLV